MENKILLKITRLFFLVLTLGLAMGVSLNALGQEPVLPTVTSDKDDYLPGEIAIITGEGWTGDQFVDIHFEEDPFVDHIHDYHDIPIAADGTFRIEFPILERHRGVAFTVHVKGKQTGIEVLAWFTDALITISSNSLWSDINTASGPGGQPNSTDQIRVGNGATLTVDVANAEVGQITLGINGGPSSGDGTLSFNLASNLSIIPGSGQSTGNLILGVSNGNRTATFDMTSGGIIKVGGSMNIVLLSASGITPGTGTIEFNRAGAQTVPTFAQLGNKAYNNLILSGSGTKSYSGLTTVSSNLSIVTGVVANLGTVTTHTAGSLTLGGLGSDDGTWGSTTSTATFKNNTFFASTTGLITVNTDTRATPTVTPTIGTYVYNGNQNGPTAATNTGTGTSYTFSYSGVGSTSYGPSATLPINAGTYTVTASVTASSDGFYKEASSVATPFSITAKDLVVSATADDKEYDGNTTAVATLTTDALGGDDVTAAYTAANFDDKNVGTGKTVTVTGISISGADAGNYTLTNTTATALADITTATVTVTAQAATKVYDGNTSSAVAPIVTGIIGPDAVDTAPTQTYDNANVGTGKVLSANGLTINDGNGGNNYTITYVSNNMGVITPLTIVVTPNSSQTKVYGSVNPTYTYGFAPALIGSDAFSGALSRDPGEDVGMYNITKGTLALNSNYTLQFVTGVKFAITPLAVTVTADAKSKFCGQIDPPLTYVSSPAVGTVLANGQIISFTGALTRIAGEGVGNYAIQQGTVANSNYAITYVGTNLVINGVTIDASASSTPVPVGQSANLSATVTPNVSGVSVIFTVTDEADVVVYTSPAILTDGSGFATATTTALGTLGVYKVTATAGSGCATSTAFIPVFDASGSFVTGGGWINSPTGAMPANPTAVGKANFGFVSKYKKGSSQVDGNTEFQFQAGDLSFKSTMHESGSLVISGSKATYRGTGTINGQSGFKFIVVAIDGNWNGATGPDKFRIKISTVTGGTVIYDNQLGADENNADATILGNNGTGGGSIVIHQAKGNKRVSTELITVAWNTPVETIKQKVDQMSAGWFESRKLAMSLDAGAYDPLTPGIYELKADVVENEFFTLDEPISIQVLVQDKPMALDITLENGNLSRELRAGEVLGYLNTIDPVDNIHNYRIEEHEDLILDGDKLIWRGTTVPAQLRLTVFSTDRAGQTISREIKLIRELKPGEFFLYPNPAHRETNVMVDMDVDATVAIRIYDAIGRLVVENEAYREGSFTQTFNLDGLAAGFYNVQVKVGDMVMTKRLIIK